jgi:hypothetical protein
MFPEALEKACVAARDSCIRETLDQLLNCHHISGSMI